MPPSLAAVRFLQFPTLAARFSTPPIRLAARYALQSAALTMGLAASVLVLLGTRGIAADSEVFCSAGTLVVIGLWLGAGAFRHDAAALRLGSALWLVPIAAIQGDWVAVPHEPAAMMIEGISVAMLFAATLRSLGAEFVTDLRGKLLPPR